MQLAPSGSPKSIVSFQFIVIPSVYKTCYSRVEIDATAAIVSTSYIFCGVFLVFFFSSDQLDRKEVGVNATVDAILATLEDVIQTMQPLYVNSFSGQ